MKTTRGFQKTFALFLTLVLVFTMVCGNTSYAAASGSKKVTKLTVKTTGTMLNEGQVLTKTMLKKSLKVTAKLKNGKTKKKYTSYSCKQIGKTIKPDSKGKYKVTLKAGSAKKTVSIKVNRIQKIYVKKCSLKLTEGAKFDTKAFKKAVTVYADYKKGADKKLTTYTITAPKVVTADSKGKFVVTLKYGSKKTTVAVPVTEPTTEEPTTEKPILVNWLYFYGERYNYYPSSLHPELLALDLYMAVNLPNTYDSIEEWGFIITTKNDITDDSMVLENATIPPVGNGELKITDIVYVSLPNDKKEIPCCVMISKELLEKQATIKIRLYAKVHNKGKEETLYSDVLSFQLKESEGTIH